MLSSYLLASWEFTLRPATAPLANRAAPILLCHGTMDDKVDCSHITLPSSLFLAQVPVSCSQFCYDTLAPLVDSIKIRSAFMVCLMFMSCFCSVIFFQVHFFVIPSSLSIMLCYVIMPCHALSCHQAMSCIVMSSYHVMYCHVIIPCHVL